MPHLPLLKPGSALSSASVSCFFVVSAYVGSAIGLVPAFALGVTSFPAVFTYGHVYA